MQILQPWSLRYENTPAAGIWYRAWWKAAFRASGVRARRETDHYASALRFGESPKVAEHRRAPPPNAANTPHAGFRSLQIVLCAGSVAGYPKAYYPDFVVVLPAIPGPPWKHREPHGTSIPPQTAPRLPSRRSRPPTLTLPDLDAMTVAKLEQLGIGANHRRVSHVCRRRLPEAEQPWITPEKSRSNVTRNFPLRQVCRSRRGTWKRWSSKIALGSGEHHGTGSLDSPSARGKFHADRRPESSPRSALRQIPPRRPGWRGWPAGKTEMVGGWRSCVVKAGKIPSAAAFPIITYRGSAAVATGKSTRQAEDDPAQHGGKEMHHAEGQ